MSRLRRGQIALAVLAFLMGIGAVLVVLNGGHNTHRGAYAALALGIGWGFTGTGLYAWRRRPGSNIGPLMIAVGFSGLLKALAFSNNSFVLHDRFARRGADLGFPHSPAAVVSLRTAWRAGSTAS